ncbi:TetR/AcrR family transcriptional regulator [Streptococcus marmotae]|uniref:TetR/AcrR family transcriptional regulator n=1 Tax=Streptococcus marmotae TaxID=1825069 RepID=UPI0009EE9C2F|nr:TetR/AcrR family transcriptional regulator [Streptococcus marmotae]
MTDLKGYELTHKRILDSGKENFLKDGYERANLRKICKNAGVTTGAFYRHFEDKEHLFLTLVEPLANAILGFYSKNEAEFFQSLEKEELEGLINLKKKASVEIALYLFKNRDIFELLMYKAYGTKYANFTDRLVELEDKNQKKLFQILTTKKQVVEIPEITVHLLNHTYISSLSEIIMHSETAEEVKVNSKVISEFFNFGWKNLIGF